MQLSNWFVILAVILIIVGSCLITYSFTVKVVETNNKPRSSIHWVYMFIGLILLIIGILIVMLKIFKGCKNICVQNCTAMEGETCVSVPMNLANNIREQKRKYQSHLADGYINNMSANAQAQQVQRQ
jgi:uncharacterized membrane protein